MSIEARDIRKTFGRFVALDGVSLSVRRGELMALLGPSGCGKTTLLRVVSGLETADSGSVHIDGEDVSARPAAARRVGFVFQHYALFRHMTIAENVAFGLRVLPRSRRPSGAAIAARVAELLDLVQVGWLADRHPHQLSGGQRQRVALARALAVEPRVLLLDEPFGALDAKVRRELRRELRRLHDTLGMTSVFVTHDQEEALELADRIALLDHGRLVQIGEPQAVYDDPASAFVYHFLGHANLFPVEVSGGRFALAGLELPAGGVADGPATACVRPHEVELGGEPGPGRLPARIDQVHFAGPAVRVELELAGGARLEAEAARHAWERTQRARGETVQVALTGLRLFPGPPDLAKGTSRT